MMLVQLDVTVFSVSTNSSSSSTTITTVTAVNCSTVSEKGVLLIQPDVLLAHRHYDHAITCWTVGSTRRDNGVTRLAVSVSTTTVTIASSVTSPAVSNVRRGAGVP